LASDGAGDREAGAAVMGCVDRAFRVLAVVGHTGRETLFSDVVRESGLPKSTVHRILHSLVSVEAVERTRTGYQLGALSLELSHESSVAHDRLRRFVMPFLVELYSTTGAPASLSVLYGSTVVYLETIYNRQQRTMVLRTDRQAPAHATAAGKLLLAYLTADGGDDGCDAELVPYTGRTIANGADLGAELARIRSDGIAYNREEYVSGLVGLAAGVVGAAGRPVAAIGILGPVGLMDLDASARAVRSTAHEVSVALRRESGWVPPARGGAGGRGLPSQPASR
jgi:DNA-binding IclR family transcriptional regulator